MRLLATLETLAAFVLFAVVPATGADTELPSIVGVVVFLLRTPLLGTPSSSLISEFEEIRHGRSQTKVERARRSIRVTVSTSPGSMPLRSFSSSRRSAPAPLCFSR